jgi:carnitine-CoA ligase
MSGPVSAAYSFTHADPQSRTLGRLLERAAADEPDRPWLLVGETGALSYGDVNRLVNSLASGLSARGVQKSDRLCVICPNGLESVLFWFAAAKLGAVYVPVNIHYRGPVLTHAIRVSGPKVVVVWSGLVDLVTAAIAEADMPVEIVAVTHDESAARPGSGLVWWETLRDHSQANLGIDVAPSDIQSIILTSGTTGPSKGVMVTHNQAYAFADIVGQATRLTPDDTYFTCLPLFHINAELTVLTGLVFRNSVALYERFSARRFWADIERTNATIVSLFGSMAQILLKGEDARARPNSLRACWAFPAGADVTPAMESTFGLKVLTAYPSTEANFVSVTSLDETSPPGSVGRVHPAFEVRIADEYDQPLPAGERGEILVRPREPYIMLLGYFGDPDATVRASRNLWYHSGDLGYFDSAGYLYFVDRLNDTIRRNGENISPVEVEQVINSNPDVIESAAVGVPGEFSETEVMAFVVPAPGARLEPSKLREWCAERMAYYMTPRHWELREALPKTPNGKIQRAVLRVEGTGKDTWSAPPDRSGGASSASSPTL